MTRHEARALERAIGEDIDRTLALRDLVLVGGVEEVPSAHAASAAGTVTAEYCVRLLIVHPGNLPHLVASRAEWNAVKTALLRQRQLTGSRSI
ncbi:MAG TPA: hypothetical protein VGS80_01355 [Ktedonobacterales bacterium]|nr:hypothetical protein [Ktedonobacterales bacterium]